KLVRRPGERAAGLRRREGKQDGKVGCFGQAPGDLIRKGGDDAQNRPLARLRHGLARRGGTRGDRGTESPRRQPEHARGPSGESLEELREDRSRVPARSHQRFVGGEARDAHEISLARSGDRRRNPREGRGELRRRVVVGDWKNVYAVEVLTPRGDGASSRCEGAPGGGAGPG